MKLKQYLVESSLSRIWQLVEEDKYNFGIVSAYVGILSKKDNEQNHFKLKSSVREMGYGYIEMRGGYKEVTGFVMEKSLLIPCINKLELIGLGEKFNQESVIYKNKFEFVEIGSNSIFGTGKLIRNFIFKKGKQNIELSKEIMVEFFSKLMKGSHKGKKFVFKIEELESNSFNRMAYGDGRKGIPLKWYTIYEEDF